MHIPHHTARRIVAILACGATIAGVSACGSSGKKSSTKAAASTPAATSTPASTGTVSTPASTGTTGTVATTPSASAGSSSPTKYVAAVKGLVNSFQASVQKFQTAGEAASKSQSFTALAAALDTLATSTDQFAAGLSKLTPPANGANFQSTAVSVLHQMAATIRKTSTAVKNKDEAAASQSEAQLAQELSKLTTVESQLTNGG